MDNTSETTDPKLRPTNQRVRSVPRFELSPTSTTSWVTV